MLKGFYSFKIAKNGGGFMNISDVLTKVKNDEALKTKFVEALKEKKVADFFKSFDVDTTEEEVLAFLTSQKSELSDNEADNISGGGFISFLEHYVNPVLSAATQEVCGTCMD